MIVDRPAFQRTVYAVLTIAALATTAAVWALVRPIPAWQPPTPPPQPPKSETSPAQPLTLDELAAIWQRDLRQPLFDPEPEPPKPAKRVKPPPIELVGTAVEAERRFGLFKASRGTVVKRVGEQIDGFEVVAIERGAARIQKANATFELRVPWYDKLRIQGGGEHASP